MTYIATCESNPPTNVEVLVRYMSHGKIVRMVAYLSKQRNNPPTWRDPNSGKSLPIVPPHWAYLPDEP